MGGGASTAVPVGDLVDEVTARWPVGPSVVSLTAWWPTVLPCLFLDRCIDADDFAACYVAGSPQHAPWGSPRL